MQLTLTKSTLYKSLGAIATLLTIAVALQNLNCFHEGPLGRIPPPTRTKVTRTAEARPVLDTVHDTIYLTRIRFRARANRAVTDTVIVFGSDTARPSLQCLDSLLQSADTSIAGPDTVSICYDRLAGIFYLDLRPAPRNESIPFLRMDSIIHEDATTAITQQPTVWDKILSGLQFFGVAAIGFLLGAATHL